MKKPAAIFFSLFLFLSTMGVSVRVHYCCGRVASLEWMATTRETRQHGNTQGYACGGCCMTRDFSSRTEVQQGLADDPFPKVPVHFQLFQDASYPAASSMGPVHFAEGSGFHPDPPHAPLFIRYRVLRI